MQIRIFKSVGKETVENEVNNFINDNAIKVIDIKFDTCSNYNSVVYSIMLMYEDLYQN